MTMPVRFSAVPPQALETLPPGFSGAGPLVLDDGRVVFLQERDQGFTSDLHLVMFTAAGVELPALPAISSGAVLYTDFQMAQLSDGGFVVSFRDYRREWPEGASEEVETETTSLRRFDSSGNLVWQSDLPREDIRTDLALAEAPDGTIGLVWIDRTNFDSTDGAQNDIPVRLSRFDANGAPIGPDILLATPTTSAEAYEGAGAAAAALYDGGWAVAVWSLVGGETVLSVGLFNGDGSVRSAPVQIPLIDEGNAFRVRVLATPANGAVVLWGERDSGFDDDVHSFARKIAPDGSLGATVADLGESYVGLIDAVVLEDGRILALSATYHTDFFAEDNGNPSYWTLWGQELSADLVLLGEREKLVAEYQSLYSPRILPQAGGQALLFWILEERSSHSFLGVAGQRFDTTAFTLLGDGNDLHQMAAPGGVHAQGGNDSVTGTDGHDRMTGGAGDDLLRGEEGSDLLSGGLGDDALIGGDGDDGLDGGPGNNRLWGEAGNDSLFGGDGADTLNGGTGDDFIFGGEGWADLRDVIFGGDGNDQIDAGAGNDEVHGGAGNDTILGGFGADTLIGYAGNDSIHGGGGSDLAFGGDGDDWLNGGFGYDRLNGGGGADAFVHQTVHDHGSDWVQDYNAAEGDVLVALRPTAEASWFQVNFAFTPGAGSADVAEAFVIFRPTGRILWALVDGAAQDQINLQIGDQVFDLLA